MIACHRSLAGFWVLFLSGLTPVILSGSGKKILPEAPASPGLPSTYELPSWDVIRHLETVYASQIEPVLKRKCFACHSQPEETLWWQNLPLLEKLVDRTLEKSLKAMDLTMGFPFVGSQSVRNDFIRLRQSVLDNKMPPTWWIVISAYEFLSPGEKKQILTWIASGLQRLETAGKRGDQSMPDRYTNLTESGIQKE